MMRAGGPSQARKGGSGYVTRPIAQKRNDPGTLKNVFINQANQRLARKTITFFS
jgi:hypothetical protein